jgi:ATP-dependent RNA helicase DeaD
VPSDNLRFEDLGLSSATLGAIKSNGFEKPSPIQAAFIPLALSGVDCIGQAHTGTGKTAAFVIPMLEAVDATIGTPQALVLTPTRELSEQVTNEAKRFTQGEKKLGVACVVGGRSIHAQVEAINRGAQLIVGTPGRILDLMGRRVFNPSHLKFVVLDEADRMLDIGFLPDITKILKQCPEKRQTMLLSATMPPPVERLANRFMRDPQMVDMSQDEITSRNIEQFYLTVDADRKFGALVRILAKQKPRQALVFTRTKRGADSLYNKFRKRLPGVATLHGDLPQGKRDRVMKDFRSGAIRLLVATDIAGRGLDVSGISHIINYEIPEHCDDYVHRIGRTGRLSSESIGYAFTFVTREQGGELTRIEMRVNTMLQEYLIPGYELARPVKGAGHVNDIKQPSW